MSSENFDRAIIVKLIVEGVHAWIGCDIPQVTYLQYAHRHQFHIKVVKRVEHNDRDIEIIKFKQQITTYLTKKYYDNTLKLNNFGTKSCEDIAEEILKEFDCITVQVLEDNENGAIVAKR